MMYMAIDARDKGNVARWINAALSEEEANLVVQVFFTPHTGHSNNALHRICFFATRDIEPREELCYSYGPDFFFVDSERN